MGNKFLEKTILTYEDQPEGGKMENVNDMVCGVITDDLKNRVLESYFHPDYFDDEVVFNITKNTLLSHGVIWRDAMKLWEECENDWRLSIAAIAEYIAKTVPADKATEAMGMAPDTDLMGEYLFDEGKISHYSQKAYIDLGGGIDVFADLEPSRGLTVSVYPKGSRFVSVPGAKKISGISEKDGKVFLFVECEDGLKEITIPLK